MSRTLSRRSVGGFRFVYLAIVTAFALGLPGPGSASAAGLQATPATAPVATFPVSLEHDLAAMVLPADAFPVDGLSSAGGRLIGLEQEAAIMVDALGMGADEIGEQLEDIGWKGRYLGDVALPNEDDPTLYAIAGSSYITEYEDDAGADAGFALLEEESGNSSEDIDAPEVGDRSELTETTGADVQTGMEYVSLDFTFRSGNLVAGVGLTWFDGAPSEPVNARQMARAAETLLERVESVIDADEPGLFGMVIRMDGTEDVSLDYASESYGTLNGEVIPRFGDAEDYLATLSEIQEDAEIRAEYTSEMYFGGSGETAAYVVRVYSFDDRLDARSFVDAALQTFIDNPLGNAYTSQEELAELPEFTGAIAGASYAFPIAEDMESEGYRIWFQVDSYAVSMEMDSTAGIEPDLLFDLIPEQVDCIESGSWCEPIAVPDALVG
jgi:hypothetical protein